MLDINGLMIAFLSGCFLIVMVIYRRFRHEPWESVFVRTAFFAYLLTLIDTTLMPLPISTEADSSVPKVNNLIPFYSTYLILNSPFGLGVGLVTIVRKIALFVPLGLLWPLISRNATKQSIVAIGFGISSLIECIQGLIGVLIKFNYRSADVDDVILSLLGTLCGFLVFRLVTTTLLEADSRAPHKVGALTLFDPKRIMNHVPNARQG